METTEKVILPYVLECLNLKPNSTETYRNLEGEVRQYFGQENQEFPDVEKSLKRALDIGQNLGVVVLKNDTVRVPFKRAPRQEGTEESGSTQPTDQAEKKEIKQKPEKKPSKKVAGKSRNTNATREWIDNFVKEVINKEDEIRKRSRQPSAASSSDHYRDKFTKRTKTRTSTRRSASRRRARNRSCRNSVRRR